jgi:hypothetical protein
MPTPVRDGHQGVQTIKPPVEPPHEPSLHLARENQHRRRGVAKCDPAPPRCVGCPSRYPFDCLWFGDLGHHCLRAIASAAPDASPAITCNADSCASQRFDDPPLQSSSHPTRPSQAHAFFSNTHTCAKATQLSGGEFDHVWPWN